MLEEAIPAYLAKAVRVMAAGEAWLSRKLMAPDGGFPNSDSDMNARPAIA